MPTRLIREGILTSERVAKLDFAAEVFYRRLMSVVDDYGRYFAQPMLLRASCFPLHLDRVTDQDIERWLAAAQDAMLVEVYSAQGKWCLQLLDFRQQVRAKQSKFPSHDEHVLSECAASATHKQASAHLVVDGCEDGCEGEGDPPAPARKGANPGKATKRTQCVPMPVDFGVSARVVSWAQGKNYDLLEEHLEAFKSKCAAKGYAYVDWDAAFMEAIRTDWAGLRGNVFQHPAANREAPPSPASQTRLA